MPDTFTVPGYTLTRETVSNLLCSAFEGGSNYWASVERRLPPTAWEFDSWAADAAEAGEQQLGNTRPRRWRFLNSVASAAEADEVQRGRHYAHDYPLNPGGALLLRDSEDDEHDLLRLDEAAVAHGLAVMATKYPRHFADILAENADAITGDVLLQCALFGEVIYG